MAKEDRETGRTITIEINLRMPQMPSTLMRVARHLMNAAEEIMKAGQEVSPVKIRSSGEGEVRKIEIK
ncbi:hypothetical protein GCM10007108_00650 [Thermogymnomonas acidicola]|uniref:Uncharacterized protein n=1 Tax=Thermogymnomonas acidicola TaxID=399579 RepID=A0AA37BPK8_9ARCH|nr:hypothetical protein [Thermogymnomonas acidicola]GGM66263.1 hypothetical protein GCM10007108_00650 [Thermogymnomonas acidicola]